MAARPAVRSTIKSGSTGDDVKALQKLLNISRTSPSWASPNLTVSGTFDSATLTAVKNFQTKCGLTVDGIVGPGTWCELEWVREWMSDGIRIRLRVRKDCAWLSWKNTNIYSGYQMSNCQYKDTVTDYPLSCGTPQLCQGYDDANGWTAVLVALPCSGLKNLVVLKYIINVSAYCATAWEQLKPVDVDIIKWLV